jgi:hypothetical protein
MLLAPLRADPRRVRHDDLGCGAADGEAFMDELAAAIEATPPAEFDALPGADRSALADMVEKAARERSELIDRAIEDSMRHIPALLRGTVKRALGV